MPVPSLPGPPLASASPGTKPLPAWAAGLAFGVAGASSAVFVLWYARGTGWWLIPVGATLSAFLCGVFSWRVFSSRNGDISYLRAGLAGALAGVVSHPVTWYLAILLSLVTGVTGYGEMRVLGPGDGLWASLVFSFWSLLLAGWITVPLGAVTGIGVLWAHRRRQAMSLAAG